MLERFALLAMSVLLASPSVASEVRFRSANAIVVDEATGEVLLQKSGSQSVPIASITKLMTAMVVLDAGKDGAEEVRILDEDVDVLKHTHSRIPVGAILTRDTLLELALMSSDNRAAAALARTYPGGMTAFREATIAKIESLGLHQTTLSEPTGLSAQNRSSAQDLALVTRAASQYPEIARITSQSSRVVRVETKDVLFRNTNALVGRPGWNILLSKTGFTNEAGRCLTMRLDLSGRTILLVLLGAADPARRTADIMSVLHWASGTAPTYATARHSRTDRVLVSARSSRLHAGNSVPRLTKVKRLGAIPSDRYTHLRGAAAA